jgi:hypothetical protein
MSESRRKVARAFSGLGGKRASIGVCVILIMLTGTANAAGPKTVTLQRCGYMQRILPGGPLDTRLVASRYAVYGWHLSCNETRALLRSRGSRLPQPLMDTPTALLTFRGMKFACQSGDAGGGSCRSPYQFRPVRQGRYVHATRLAMYRNCSFVGSCSKTVTGYP